MGAAATQRRKGQQHTNRSVFLVYRREALMHRQLSQTAPTKWPFPPIPDGRKKTPKLTRGAMLADICLVLVWGAMIPGMMWLGVAVGF